MSLVAAIRDYIDFINCNYDALPLEGGVSSLFVPTFKYIIESFKYGVLYLASFQWLRDFMYLPLIVPKVTLSILKETCHPFDNPALNFFSFLEAPAYKENGFVIGLLNSFFASFPITAGHILSGRRLLVQGIPAGVAAGSGMILGQWLFVFCVIMGIRPIVVPWLALEPFNYLLGLVLLINTVYRITHERRIRIVRWSDKRELVQYFLTSFLLSWCEQSSLFQYLGNMTIDTGTNFLDNSALGACYAVGLLVGTCLFSLLFVLLAFALRRMWLRWGAVTSSRLTNQLNTFSLVALVALSFASVPYYGVDYLLTNGVGFRSQDMTLEETAFIPATIMNDPSKKLGSLSDFKSFDTDVSTFDRGLYLQEYRLVPQSFEDLNYQGEYGWTKRISKYTKYLVKRRAPSAWAELFKRIGENDNLRLRNAKDQEREQQRSLARKDKSFSTPSIIKSGARSPVAGGLENDAVKDLTYLAMDENSEYVENGIEERLEADKDTEHEFIMRFDTSLSPLFINDLPEPSTLEKRLKRKFVENPLYPLLLRVDIDSFLNRQPKMHSLSPGEEEALLLKRNILGQYYDTLRQYSQLQNSDYFQTLYHDSKSFANRVYNQQFKGTLKVVRRLFSITPGERGSDNQTSDTNPLGQSQGSLQGSPRVLKFDQPLFHQGVSTVFNIHEELTPYMPALTSPFVEPVNPRPLYAGWDEELRRLVVTNRSLSRLEAMYKALPADDTVNRSQLGIHFTLWPLNDWEGPLESSSLLRSEDRNAGLVVPPLLAFNSAAEPRNKKLTEAIEGFAKTQDQASVGGKSWEMSYWPANLKLVEANPEPLAYKRGGFVWPGHSSLRFHLDTK
jgi:hypothetical protein